MRGRRVRTTPTRFHGVLPAQWAVFGKVRGNLLMQLRRDEVVGDFSVERRASWGTGRATLVDSDGGQTTVLAATTRGVPRGDVLRVKVNDLETAGFPFVDAPSKWHRPTTTKPLFDGSLIAARDGVLRNLVGKTSLEGAFRTEATGGLREPQLGGAYGVLAHWTVREDVASVVMPTGTGKTETMLALYAHERLQRLLVVVPSDPLRDQVGNKFARLGVLKHAGVLREDAPYPIVGVVSKGFQDAAAATSFVECCNVVVTTMRLLASAKADVATALVGMFTHIFIDEAHHVPAQTWNAVRDRFAASRIVQFTATPFRDDGKFIDGAVVYRYPLSRAQRNGYFSRIAFRPIEALLPSEADSAIVAAAIGQLNNDLKAGYDHLLMARASTITRAEALITLYRDAAPPEFAPVILHSRVRADDRANAIRALRERASRIVVCVDMLGEGVDLPALKIAALHDAHRSLPVTLQFIGRFARTGEPYGEASVIANILDPGFATSLRRLYSHDADWNSVIQTLSENETSKHAARESFAREFQGDLGDIPLQNIFPKMSTVAFDTAATEWNPENIVEAFATEADHVIAGPLINPTARTIVLVTVRKSQVGWGDVREISDIVNHLHIAHWNEGAQMFFVHSSDRDWAPARIATAVMGLADIVSGERVFRVLHGINRLIMLNLGLRNTVNQRIQYNSMMGTDIAPALATAQRENRIKWNLFGTGYENGASTNIGCSQKGTIWSHRVAQDIGEWLDWTARVAQKLNDASIRTDTILQGALVPERATARPTGVPILVEWDYEILQRPEDRVFVDIGGTLRPFFEVSLENENFSGAGDIRFAIAADNARLLYELQFVQGQPRVVALGQDTVVHLGREQKAVAAYLNERFPVVRFADGSFLIGDIFCRESPRRQIYDRARIVEWDWTGVDPSKESQRTAAGFRADSIQARVIGRLLADQGAAYNVVFDDDASGEAADVIAIRAAGDRVHLDLYHCKFSATVGGARVADLYEVCGQAEKSVRWKRNPVRLLDHIRHREGLGRYGHTRFMRGDLRTVLELRGVVEQAYVDCRIHIVQPGVSRSGASDDQLELLSATESYLRETFDIDFVAIASA